MKINIWWALLLISFPMFLAGCGGDPAANQPGSGRGTIEAAAAQTVQAVQTLVQEQGGNATAVPAQLGIATDTPPADDVNEGLSDGASFVADVTIPDNSNVTAGETFEKTWRLENSGQSTWTLDFAMVFMEGDQMDALSRVELPNEVSPGETVDLSVLFTAPDDPGTYQSFWMLENAAGVQFGLGPDNDLPFFTIINSVSAGAATTDGITGGAPLSSVTLTVDPVDFSGDCPASIEISWTITSSAEGLINFGLTLTAGATNFTFDPPGVFTETLTSATTITRTYTLNLNDAVSATAQVSVTGDATLTSNVVSFTVECN